MVLLGVNAVTVAAPDCSGLVPADRPQRSRLSIAEPAPHAAARNLRALASAVNHSWRIAPADLSTVGQRRCADGRRASRSMKAASNRGGRMRRTTAQKLLP